MYIKTTEIQNHFTFVCKRRHLLCNHSNGDLPACEDIYVIDRLEGTISEKL